MAIFLAVLNGTHDGSFGGMRCENKKFALIFGDNGNTWFYALGVINHFFSPNFPGTMNSFEKEAMFYVKRIC